MDTESLQIPGRPLGDVFSEKCPSRSVLKHVTSRWGVLVIIAVKEKTSRFSELRKRISGISEKMLAQTLQSLEQDGLVKRVSYPVVPPHVEYSLTELGSDFSDKVIELAHWIENNIVEIVTERAKYENR